MDPDIAAALYGGGSDDGEQTRSRVTEMPVQRIEGDPEAGMSVMEKLGRRLKETLRAAPSAGSVASTPAAQALGGGFDHGISAGLERRLPGGMGELAREVDDSARKTSPSLYGGADALGMVANPASVGSGLGGAAATNGLQSAARAVGDSNPDEDIITQAFRALAHGTEGAGIGALAHGAGEALGALAPTARRFAVGGTSKDYGDIVKEQGTRAGIDYIQKDLGKIPEEQGLVRPWPQSRASYAKRAAERTEDVVGPEIGATLKQAEGEIPSDAINRRVPMRAVEAKANDLQNAGRPGWRQMDQATDQMARAPFETPTDIAKLKRAYEAESYATGAIGGSRESRYATAQKAGADATRSHLSDVMNSADPVTAARFEKANRDFSDTKLIEHMASKGSMYDFAAPLAGAGIGGFTGYEAGHDMRSTAGGMAAGALAGRYGADMVANVARGGERVLEQPGIRRLGALLTDEKRASAQDVSADTRGHKIPEAIQSALRDNKLGPYSDEFARAAMSDQPGALGVAYQKLSSDPQFAPYKRLLQEMTGDM